MAWLPNLALAKANEPGRQLVAMCRGMVALTRDPDGTHRLWIMGIEIEAGDAATVRSHYADHLPDDWLKQLYR